jgi:hypothetical protein
MMNVIDVFNKNISNVINKRNNDYKAIFGDAEFTPEPIIVQSSDFKCGALSNELESLKKVSEYYTFSFDLDTSEGTNLDALENAFIDLPRRNRSEPDIIYRKRFRTIVNQSLNKRRTTRWAIMDALRYFISTVDSTIQIVEIPEVHPSYFQLRVEGVVTFDSTIFLGNIDQSYLDQNFVGGEGVGEVVSYLGEIIDRIKASGVDYDIIFIKQLRFTKTVNSFIGRIQKYKTSNATILRFVSITKSSDATIV